MRSVVHVPVLLEKVVELLATRPGGRYVDCTVGQGGHALAVLERILPGGQLLGIDADPEAIGRAKERLRVFGTAAILVNANFADLEPLCRSHDFYPVQGILFDLGLSSLQLDEDGRGFSFRRDAPLNMRFDPRQGPTASDLVNTLSEEELAAILERYGEERFSRRISHHIVKVRPISSTSQLAEVVEQAVGARRGRIHPATRTFQALRIAVNHELENLEKALGQAVKLLELGGRLVVISYHSLEDRIVKNFIRRESRDCLCPREVPVCSCGHLATLVLLTKKVVTPSSTEVALNPRSRSAKLRAAERISSPKREISKGYKGDIRSLSSTSTFKRRSSLDHRGPGRHGVAETGRWPGSFSSSPLLSAV